MKRILLLATAIPLVPALGGCWDGWRNIFDPTPSREHRLEDLRVLAVLSEPAGVSLPASIALSGEGTITLDVEPRIFDPRGGDIDVTVRLCAKRSPSFSTCIPTATGLPSVAKTTTVDEDDPLGAAPMRAELVLDAEHVRALYAEAGAPFPSFELLGLDVIVDVSRDFNGTRERESAALTLPMMFDPTDPAFPEALRAELLDAVAAVDCRDIPTDGCFPLPDPDNPPPIPVCGNGVIEPGESCEPPGTDACDETCFALDFCEVEPVPICALPPGNSRPALVGLQTPAEPFALDDEPADIERGGVIRVKPGEATFIAPAQPFAQNTGTFPTSFETGCPADSAARATSLACSSETLTWRAYILDESAELVHPLDEAGVYFGNFNLNGFEAVGVTFKDGTAAGTREPIIMVLTDGRGGMDLQVFTLEAE